MSEKVVTETKKEEDIGVISIEVSSTKDDKKEVKTLVKKKFTIMDFKLVMLLAFLGFVGVIAYIIFS